MEQTFEFTRKEAILKSAAELFSRQGYEATTVGMIAARAKVSQGLLYNYFENKADLLQNIFLKGFNDVRSFMQQYQLPSGGTPLGRLLRKTMAAVKGNLPFWKLFYSLRMQPAARQLIEADMSSWTSFMRDEIEKLLKQQTAPDPAAETTLLLSLIDGLCQHYVLAPSSFPVEPIIRVIEYRFS